MGGRCSAVASKKGGCSQTPKHKKPPETCVSLISSAKSLPCLASTLASRLLKPLILLHPVAYTDFCKDILGFSWIFLKLSADMGHIDSENLVVTVSVGPPDF